MPKVFVQFLCCLFTLAAAGCGARYGDGQALEKQGRLLQAAEKYRAFALRNPADPSAPKALLSAAELYAVKLGLCAQSQPLLERLVREYPSYKLPEDVFRRIFVCPDYFPAGAGARWKYGDSQTLGQNAVQTVEVSERGPKGSAAKSSFYAGSQLVSSQQKVYRFSGLNFLELQDGEQTLLLSYPLQQGKTWTSGSAGARLEFRVEQTGLKVKVAAGEFADCVKVSRRTAGLPSWIYEYYAPWTGKILTSIGGRGYENRVTELLEYEEKK
jgi:hypothetical protein